MNISCLAKTETKSPFLIGVAGGTACGKVHLIFGSIIKIYLGYYNLLINVNYLHFSLLYAKILLKSWGKLI